MSSESVLYHFHTPNVLAVSIAMPIVGALLVATRFRVRKTQNTRVSIDDWLILVALAMVVGMGVCLIVGVKTHLLGYVKHRNEISPLAGPVPDDKTAAVKMQQIVFAYQIMMLTSYALIKLSIIYFLRRLFVVGKTGPFNWITNTLVVVVSVWLIVSLLVFVILYGFVSSNHWETATMSFMGFIYAEVAMAASDSLLDIVIFILPFLMICRLHMSRARKAGVSGIFLVGGGAFGASLVRLAVCVNITKNVGNTFMNLNFALTFAMYWAIMEAGLGLIAACLPSLAALLPKRSFASTMTSVRSSTLQSLRYSPRSFRSQQTQNDQVKRDNTIFDSSGRASYARIVTEPENVELGGKSLELADIHKSHNGDTTKKISARSSLSHEAA